MNFTTNDIFIFGIDDDIFENRSQLDYLYVRLLKLREYYEERG